MISRCVRAAVATFLEMGYAGASMETIAKAAGITKRSLYARYADKRAVFADVIPWALARYVDDGSDGCYFIVARLCQRLRRLSVPAEQRGEVRRIDQHDVAGALSARRHPDERVELGIARSGERMRAVRVHALASEHP